MGASITIFIAICCIFVTALACLPEGPQECDTLVNCIKSANYEMQTTCKQQVQQIDLQPVENTAYSQCSKKVKNNMLTGLLAFDTAIDSGSTCLMSTSDLGDSFDCKREFHEMPGDQDDLREKRELPPALKPVADQTGKAFKCIDEQGKRAEKCLDDYKLKCGRLNMCKLCYELSNEHDRITRAQINFSKAFVECLKVLKQEQKTSNGK